MQAGPCAGGRCWPQVPVPWLLSPPTDTRQSKIRIQSGSSMLYKCQVTPVPPLCNRYVGFEHPGFRSQCSCSGIRRYQLTLDNPPHVSRLKPRASSPSPWVIANASSSTIVVFDICYQVVLALFRTLPGRCDRSRRCNFGLTVLAVFIAVVDVDVSSCSTAHFVYCNNP